MRTKKPTSIAGRQVELSNLDKLMYHEGGFSKGQVIDYYTRVSRYILPHIKDRPITLKRYPDGVKGKHFYEKDAPSFTPKWVKTFPIERASRESVINYILINDLPALVWSANTANLEIHPFLAKVPRIDVPTMVVFDLDPGEGADILKSCEAALLVKAVLDRLNLKSFAKVSGSKGIHLHVPLNTRLTYQATRPFAILRNCSRASTRIGSFRKCRKQNAGEKSLSTGVKTRFINPLSRFIPCGRRESARLWPCRSHGKNSSAL